MLVAYRAMRRSSAVRHALLALRLSAGVSLTLPLGACGDPPPPALPTPSAPAPSTGPPPGPPRSGGPPPAGPAAGPGAGPEDLAGSWRPDLAVPVPALTPPGDCPDGDGDGFPSALLCPALPPERADCDDADPRVTPATERWVRPGPFLMGSASAQAGHDEQPVHVVTLSGYCLDRAELTVQAFSDWLQAGGRDPEGPDVRSLDGAGRPAPGRGPHPAEGLTWSEADAICRARGKLLPTEAQWEKAARGGCEGGRDPSACDPSDLRPYPWGTQAPDCARANHQVTDGGPPRLCVSDTVLADALPAGEGPYGHQHLAGNVWEFVSDAWHPAVYTQAPRVDPGGAPGGEHHGLRGGGWNTFSTNMRVANRFHDLVMGSATGARCARPTVAPTPDTALPMELVTLRGTVRRIDGPLVGRALYVTAFDAEGGAQPGRSPVAEVRLAPSGQDEQPFALRVPRGGTYLVSAALDGGTGGQKEGYGPASGSGGFGEAEQNPVEAATHVSDLRIALRSAPAGPVP